MVLQAVSNSGVSSENSIAYKHLFQLQVMILLLIVDMIRRTAAICARRVTDARPGFKQTPDAVGLLDIALEFVLRPRLPAPVRPAQAYVMYEIHRLDGAAGSTHFELTADLHYPVSFGNLVMK